MIESSANSDAVFDRYGLGTAAGFWGKSAFLDDEGSSADVGKRLRQALEQLGGLYAAFGRFLNYRSDLLDASTVADLRGLQLQLPVVPVSDVGNLIRRELGTEGRDLAEHLEPTPVWNTLARTAYSSRYQDQSVIIQVARDPVSEESFQAFEKGIRSLGRSEVAAMVSPGVLKQFRQFIRRCEPLDRERSLLNTLANYKGELLVEYPRLIPELSQGSMLCWNAVEGRPLSELIAEGNAEAPVLLATAVLEQFYSLSIVDADLDPAALIVDSDRRLHYRRLNAAISVLPHQVDSGIEYAAAVVSGNASLSAQKLVRLTIGRSSPDYEKQLLDEFSGIEPELKINSWYPSSAEAFENNWRALASIFPARPLFLDLLHRNLVASGYWNSDTVRAGAPASDAIAEAQWPVVARLISTQFGMLMKREAVQEWAIGSGLLLVGALREMNQLVEQIRENDVRIGLDFDEPPKIEGDPSIKYGFLLVILLAIFLTGLHWGGLATEPWATPLKILAGASLPAMFWALSKIG